MSKPKKLELLAPARDADVARRAILHGADAVYIGGPSHGARAAAGNSISDIAELVTFARQYSARVYVTLNTIIYDSELEAVRRTVCDLYRAGVDALIVQDMALTRLDIPPIPLHASTQCDIRTPQKARFLADVGFTQLVLPRELSLDEIAEMRRAVPAEVELEAFVHGALCVSYSGDCQASCAAMGRSANRGECAQMCRLPYDLIDGAGRVVLKSKHLLSLRDLNRLPDIEALADAGVTSFKIEGRLKDADYVTTVVAAYRRAIDSLIAARPDSYARSSVGEVITSLRPDIDKTFNRGYTSYFLRPNPGKMANFDAPNRTGLPVARVTQSAAGRIRVSAQTTLNNGDGLAYFTPEGSLTGFRLNRVDGDTLYPATPQNIPVGTTIYRTFDAAHARELQSDSTRRLISVDVSLRMIGTDRIGISLTAADGIYVELAEEVAPQTARTPQRDTRRKAFAKLGDTIYTLRSYDDTIADDLFIPASALTAMRRRAIDALESARRIAYPLNVHRRDDRAGEYILTDIDYHHNVANRLAEDFYRSHGVTSIRPAAEIEPLRRGDVVMTTRYCLRRELGACLRTPEGKKLAAPLSLQHGRIHFDLQFDCQNCRMGVIRQ